MLTDAQIQRLLDVANAACHKGYVEDARTVYEGVLAVKPGFAPALIGQALTHVVVDDFDGAASILQDEVLRDRPDDADALSLLGLSCMLAGRHDEARAVLVRVPEGCPAGEMARNILAEME